MSIPAGARWVTYEVSARDGENVLLATPPLEFSLDPMVGTAAELDTAYQAAMDALVAHLETEYPSPNVIVANRYYTCLQMGDTWPTP